ncbi:MAG TPA: ribonuclease Y [Verrucomicrobiae bacterium]|nr:ribonuclease Y [Verrucomicrobiae bacterium]
MTLVSGVGAGYWNFRRREKKARVTLAQEQQAFLEKARQEADVLLREAKLAASEEALKLREQMEKAFATRRREMTDMEQRLAEREGLINRQMENLARQECDFREKDQALQQKLQGLETERCQIEELGRKRREQLQELARLTSSEAREQLLKEVEQESARDALELSRRIVEQAKQNAEDQARRIISIAIQRYAGEHTFESTTATVALQGDDMKGRIIGREGRNIRAFEAATGVTVLIDDTPNAVVLSSFDPVRREIARDAMQRLIQDGRIHPTRIEEIVAKVQAEMDEIIVRSGEEAVFKTGLPSMHKDVVSALGRLRFRHSFSQNLLDHSIEVAHFVGLMAAELGIDVVSAKRAGLLHDIGKAMDHEIEGPHAIVGGEFVKRYGESPDVVNGVASHHDEVPHTCPLGILVSAADAISASRPGARSETMTTYIRRLENLEQIGLSFEGVEKCFAVQAGRELRVVVLPETINDVQAGTLARNIARKIEDELQYPGQIRVTVVRETRCVEFAK